MKFEVRRFDDPESEILTVEADDPDYAPDEAANRYVPFDAPGQVIFLQVRKAGSSAAWDLWRVESLSVGRIRSFITGRTTAEEARAEIAEALEKMN